MRLTLLPLLAAATCDVGHVPSPADPAACDPCSYGTWNDGRMAQCQFPVKCDPGFEPNAYAANASDCLACIPGYFNDGVDVSLCKPMQCLNGTSSAGSGAKDATTTCTPCQVNTFGLGKTTHCVACPPAWFAPVGASACEPVRCPRGAIPAAAPTSATDCTPCPSGTFANGAVCDVMACPGGRSPRSNATSRADCEDCALGMFSPGGAAPCAPTQCEPGFRVTPHAVDAKASCVACPPGHISAGGTAATCAPCAAGTFAAGDTCAPATCPPGLYAPPLSPDGVASCVPCARGSFSPGRDAPTCTSFTCAAGHEPRVNASSSADCDTCPRGWYAEANSTLPCRPAQCALHNQAKDQAQAALDCEPCPIGQSSVGGAALCNAPNCTAGTQPTRNGTACSLCPRGTFSPGQGAPCEATQCPTSQTPQSGAINATDCLLCDDGTTNNGGTELECKPCPLGQYRNTSMAACVAATCDDGWQATSGAKHSRDCVMCPQGTYGRANLCLPTQCPRHTSSPKGATDAVANCVACAPGYLSPGGPAPCEPATCAPGAEWHSDENHCVACPAGTFGRGAAMLCEKTHCAPGFASTIVGAAHPTDPCVACVVGWFSPGSDVPCASVTCPAGSIGAISDSDSESESTSSDPIGHDRGRLHVLRRWHVFHRRSKCNRVRASAVPMARLRRLASLRVNLRRAARAGVLAGTRPTRPIASRATLGLRPRGAGPLVIRSDIIVVDVIMRVYVLQIACPAGQYATESSEECMTCPAGTYSVRPCAPDLVVGARDLTLFLQNGDSVCKPTECPPGSGAVEGATDATKDCQVCQAGEFSLGDDHPCAPTSCPVGTASAIVSSDLEKGHCLPCAEGYYSAGGRDQCKQALCPAGAYFPIGAKDSLASCQVCPAGTFSDGTAKPCANTTCLPGSASPLGATTAQGQCQQCDLGSYSPGGAGQCRPTKCKPGFEPVVNMTTASAECVACAAGTFSEGSTKTCKPMQCKPGFASNRTAASDPTATCTLCATGWFSADGSSQCAIMQCSPGTASNATGATDISSTCAPCPQGTFSLGLDGPCLPTTCPTGTAAPAASTDATANCSICVAGTFSPGATAPCAPTQCPPGASFHPVIPPLIPTAGSAAPAQAGSATTNCTTCAAGSYSAGGIEPCDQRTACPQGYAAPAGATSAQGQCALCAPGWYSPGRDQPCVKLTCEPGHGASEGTDTCKPCAAGYFGQDAICKPMTCALGTASNTTGATSPNATCTLCAAGTFSAGGVHHCRPTHCAPGSASPAGADVPTAQCSWCPPGSYSPGVDAPCSTGDCPVGSAMPPGATSSAECFACAFGYYSTGHTTQCVPCTCATAATSCFQGTNECGSCPNAASTWNADANTCVGSSASPTTRPFHVTVEVVGFGPSLWSPALTQAWSDVVASLVPGAQVTVTAIQVSGRADPRGASTLALAVAGDNAAAIQNLFANATATLVPALQAASVFHGRLASVDVIKSDSIASMAVVLGSRPNQSSWLVAGGGGGLFVLSGMALVWIVTRRRHAAADRNTQLATEVVARL
ncbi:Aste57867_899 [Aphanomyces stellatus]|uniref:Aste57867_899 protein n=1 Tax=Aphanomyces stellatus TaxID=120398 RepID=A0A485K724_9STRA|nr:hypothetical protein As57867_000898 [Aphanomyces stellatus]VFT78123.1 Aste57867_899 [Aphanomyces stellatus]